MLLFFSTSAAMIVSVVLFVLMVLCAQVCCGRDQQGEDSNIREDAVESVSGKCFPQEGRNWGPSGGPCNSERCMWRVASVPMQVFNRNSPLFHQGDQVHKSVFIIFFQGDQLKNRVKKICEGLVLRVMKSKCLGQTFTFQNELVCWFYLESCQQKNDIATQCSR